MKRRSFLALLPSVAIAPAAPMVAAAPSVASINGIEFPVPIPIGNSPFSIVGFTVTDFDAGWVAEVVFGEPEPLRSRRRASS